MPKGTIRRLITDRGFGFIGTAEGKDIFFHRNELQGVDYSSLREGQQVEFEVGRGHNGRPQAVKVKLAQPKMNGIKPRQELKEANDEPVWKEGPFLFGVLFFPGILLLCLILYWIQVFILKP
jgi:CspA family cold shock protein